MDVMAKVAAQYGKVDPKNGAAVQKFFEETVPTLSMKKREEILDEVLSWSTGVDATLGRDTSTKNDT